MYQIIKMDKSGKTFNVYISWEDLGDHIKAMVEYTPEYTLIAVIKIGPLDAKVKLTKKKVKEMDNK